MMNAWAKGLHAAPAGSVDDCVLSGRRLISSFVVHLFFHF